MRASSQVAVCEPLWELEHVHTTHPHCPPLPHKKLFLHLLFSCTFSIVQLHVQILRQRILALLVLELYERKLRCHKVFCNLPFALSIVCKIYHGLSLVAAIHSTVCTYQNLFALFSYYWAIRSCYGLNRKSTGSGVECLVPGWWHWGGSWGN